MSSFLKTKSNGSIENTTSEYTSKTIRILQNRKKFKQYNFFKPEIEECELNSNTNEIDEEIDMEKEINPNDSNICDNSMVKGIESIRRIFEIKSTENNFLENKTPKENPNCLIKIKDKKQSEDKEKEKEQEQAEVKKIKVKNNKIRNVKYIVGIIAFILLLGLFIRLSFKFLL